MDRCSHEAASAGLEDELAVDALRELVVHAGVLAGLARGVLVQALELVAAQYKAEEGTKRAGVSGYF